MADFAVVIVLSFVVSVEVGRGEGSMHKTWPLSYGRDVKELRDNILVLVMWKLDRELAWTPRISKCKSRVIFWRYLGMADRTNRGFRSFEELRTMTIYTGVMVRIVGDVRVISHLSPVVGRNFVAGIAGFLM